MRYLLILLLLIVGCSAKIEVVYVPQLCVVEQRQMPLMGDDLRLNIINLIEHLQLIISDLDYCQGK